MLPDAISKFATQFLADNYFTFHEIECSICMCAESADIGHEGSSSNPNTAVIKIDICGHIFHSTCLSKWVDVQIKSNTNATCPICRHIIIEVQDSLDADVLTSMDRGDEVHAARLRRPLGEASGHRVVRGLFLGNRRREAEARPGLGPVNEHYMRLISNLLAQGRPEVEVDEVEQSVPSV